MNRLISICALAFTAVACGDNGAPAAGSNGGGHDGGGGDGPVYTPAGLSYSDPQGGALQLVRNASATPTAMLLDFVVGDAPLTGYATGFDLPIEPGRVTLGPFKPGQALDPGSAPAAAKAVIADRGPLRGMLVVAQSQKAAGTGAVVTDTVLVPGTVLFTIELDLAQPRTTGVVFDGTSDTFVLPSGGLRNKVGLTVVEARQVKIGKLEVR